MTDIYADRIARLRARMAETGTDLVAVGPTSHMAWLAGLNPHGDERPVMLLVSATHAGVLMPALNAESSRQMTDLPFQTWEDATGPDAALAQLLADCGATGTGLQVALDEAMRTDFSLLLLDALDGPRRSFTHDTVGYLRARKEEVEADGLRASARLNDAAVQAAWAALKPGMTELDVQAIIRDYYKANGAQPEFTIVGFGANSAYPHHHTGQTRLEPDMAVLIDTGCRLNGYPSDMTRCGWFGTPDPQFLEVAAVVEGAVQAALNAARPGMAAADLDKVARDHIAAAGYGPQFLHRLGHGLGIDVHEPPYISAANPAPLAAGNVFSIEPGIYLDGKFGIRLEDIVILREDGPEIFSGLSRDLVITPTP